MWLQVDKDFHQVKMKALNDKYSVEMFMKGQGREIFCGRRKNKRISEQNNKTECSKDERAAHSHSFAVCREYEY